jgi:hypothetical protein
MRGVDIAGRWNERIDNDIFRPVDLTARSFPPPITRSPKLAHDFSANTTTRFISPSPSNLPNTLVDHEFGSSPTRNALSMLPNFVNDAIELFNQQKLSAVPCGPAYVHVTPTHVAGAELGALYVAQAAMHSYML